MVRMPSEYFLAHIWLIPLFPLMGAALMLFIGRRLPNSGVNVICVGSVLLSALYYYFRIVAHAWLRDPSSAKHGNEHVDAHGNAHARARSVREWRDDCLIHELAFSWTGRATRLSPGRRAQDDDRARRSGF
jgi:hypothetical protein